LVIQKPQAEHSKVYLAFDALLGLIDFGNQGDEQAAPEHQNDCTEGQLDDASHNCLAA
jgi:hypothetical protein